MFTSWDITAAVADVVILAGLVVDAMPIVLALMFGGWAMKNIRKFGMKAK